MGSATREALAQSVAALDAAADAVAVSTAAELLDAGRVIDGSAQLRALIADPAAEPDVKAAVANKVFAGRLGDTALSLLTSVARERWSSEEDLVAGVEEIGVRAAALADASAPIESELFQFGRVVASDSELELALSAKLGSAEGKAKVVESLLREKASDATVLIVSHLVRLPRGRRVGELLRDAASIVADQRGRTVATVTSAAPLSEAQIDKLRAVLSGMYGRDIAFNRVVDPALVGGIRIQAGDDVIDGSIATRLADLKLKLAG